MKQSLIALTVLAVAMAAAGCASTPAPPTAGASVTVEIQAERIQQCKQQGGCTLVSFEELLQSMAEVYELGAADACRKGGP